MLASSIPFLLGLVMLTMGMTLGARDFLPRFCERLKPVLPKLSLASVHFASLALAAVPGAVFSVWHNLSGFAVAFGGRFFRRD